MPGIESRDPERTAKRRGLLRLPKPLPRIFSMRWMASSICASISFGSVLPCSLNRVQTSVVMVKPGGTGSPMRHFREVRALAAEERLHLAVAVAAAVAEEINQLALFGLGGRVAVAVRDQFQGGFFRGLARLAGIGGGFQEGETIFFLLFLFGFFGHNERSSFESGS
jgi:hypothetical protein